MSRENKAELYDRFVSEYHRLDNQIGQIRLNNFEITKEDQDKINLLEEKKKYILGRIRGFN
mgnify:FL=1